MWGVWCDFKDIIILLIQKGFAGVLIFAAICIAMCVCGAWAYVNRNKGAFVEDDDDEDDDFDDEEEETLSLDLDYKGEGSYIVDAFTEKSLENTPDFPENTYHAISMEEVFKIVHNCSREIAGIKQIRVTVNRPHNNPPYEGI
jgi:hypothetical protein